MSNKKLEIKDVEKSFGNKRILENINFEVCCIWKRLLHTLQLLVNKLLISRSY